jgi:prophage antirepressor-like protein
MKTQMATFHSSELDFSLSGMLYQGKPVFDAVALAKSLGYANPADALKTHCKSLIKLNYSEARELGFGDKLRGIQLAPESDAYRLILRSQLPKAERVQDWVCEDVLPSIRATGSYSMAAANTPDFDDPIAAAEAWIEARKAERLAIGYVERQARYISKLESHLDEGITPVQFCKQLNGVNTRLVNAFLEERNWLYDDQPEAKNPRWRVKHYARDQYLTERSGWVEQTDGDMRKTFKPILLLKGAAWIYRHYLNGEFPMKKTWDGEYTHDTDLMALIQGGKS